MKLLTLLAGLIACSNSNQPGPVENAGTSCTTASQCYPTLDAGALKGAVDCLTKVSGGYCTHLCTSDADCCAVPGECRTGFAQVCAPFESTGQMRCFLSCEAKDIAASGTGVDDSTYCRNYASAAFGCRSTGGGSANRKVCLP